MATATYTKANDAIESLMNGGTNVSTDTFMIALSNTAPASEASNPLSDNNGVLANVTQIAYTNYTDDLTVDRTLEGVTVSQTGGTLTIDASNFVITASGGAIADFRYIYVYDDSITGDPIIGVWDYGSTLSRGDGDSANVNVNASGLISVT